MAHITINGQGRRYSPEEFEAVQAGAERIEKAGITVELMSFIVDYSDVREQTKQDKNPEKETPTVESSGHIA